MLTRRGLLLATFSSMAACSSSSNTAISAAAHAFIEARLHPLSPIAGPSNIMSIAEGYEVQREMVKVGQARLGAPIGWKCGATNAGAQAAMNFGPFYGPLFANCVVPNKGKTSMKGMGSFRASEAEFAFFLSTDCPPKADGTPYTDAEMWPRVASIASAIELAATRCSDQPLSPQTVLGDFALNACIVLGDKIPAERIAAWESLADVDASLKVNGATVAAEKGANVLGNPLCSLTWLANTLNEVGLQLKAGDCVMTGAAAASKTLAVGDTLEACFENFGGDVPNQVTCLEIIE